jgi:septal ring-binding cell division protein DamX
MTQHDMPAPAVVGEETAVTEYVPPAPPRPEPKPAQTPKPAKPAPRQTAAPDPFAVGVRVLKMAPAWLLFTAVCCTAVVLLLGWVRSSGEVEAFTLNSKRNDARPSKCAAAPAPETAKAAAEAPETAKAAAEAPAPSAAPKPAAEAQAPAKAEAPAPKVEEKPRVEMPAPVSEGGGNFTAQVGSFNSQSEANARVSSLRAAGFEARVTAAELPGRGTWYRVQVGRFGAREEAAKAVAALRSKGAAAGALVVPVQK